MPSGSYEGRDGTGNYMSNGNGSGTIIYTGSSVMCTTIFYHTEIGKYIWAQGGISMSLGNKE